MVAISFIVSQYGCLAAIGCVSWCGIQVRSGHLNIHIQVIGNVCNDTRHPSQNPRRGGLQLQQCQIGIAIKGAVLALLGDIVLEDGGGLGVVSVQAVEDSVDVRRAGLALVERGDHVGLRCCCLVEAQKPQSFLGFVGSERVRGLSDLLYALLALRVH